MQSAAKVGLLVIAFVLMLFGAYAVLGRTLFAPKADEYYAEFEDAGGVIPSTTVQMAGVKIGSVSAVDLIGPKRARITFKVKEGLPLPVGTVATVSTPLIGLGEVPLILVPPDTPAGSLPPKSTLPGRKAGALDSILPNSKETVAELTRTMAAVRRLLEDQGLKKHADQLLATSEKTIGKFGDLATTVNSMLAQNQTRVAEALQSATLALNDFRGVTHQVLALLQEGKLQKDAKTITTQLAKASVKANDLVASMDKLVNDPNLKGTIANVQSITNTGKDIAENTRQITEQGIEISKNVNEITKKTIPAVDTAKEVLTKASDIEDQMKGVLDKVGGFFTRKPGPGPLSGVGLSMDLLREDKPGYWRTDLGVTFPISDGTFHAGFYDAFGSNKLILQLGKQKSPALRYRYGIYAAKPGVGVDYVLTPKVTLRGDLWDINRLRADLRASYDFGNGIVGWLGVDRLFDRNTATFGFGLRR